MHSTDLNSTLPQVYTVSESMAALRCSKSKVYRLTRSGHLVAVKVGNRLLIPKSAVLALLTPKGRRDDV